MIGVAAKADKQILPGKDADVAPGLKVGDGGAAVALLAALEEHGGCHGHRWQKVGC